ncbi:hypothetical protein OSCI_4120040 [Kamptonema sp. PCC 6506]|nr:hypothetical protein OSCI_4120040 [Kamptonema sp. PCC 6506]
MKGLRNLEGSNRREYCYRYSRTYAYTTIFCHCEISEAFPLTLLYGYSA